MALIPIIDRKGLERSRLKWKGGTERGSCQVLSSRENERFAHRVRVLILDHADLSDVRFVSRKRGININGWDGFEGTLHALNAILPYIDLYVDWDHVDWPDEASEMARSV
jgi:hypothetical protein